MKNHCDTLIVGAGVAGLVAARELARAGHDVIVLDKGRGVGGRMATRRFAGARFDHGAQFISVRTEAFERLVREWVDAGVARVWSHGFADGLTGDGSLLTGSPGGDPRPHTPARDGHPRYCSPEGMTAIPKHLADGPVARPESRLDVRLDVRLGVRATAVRRRDDGWEVYDEATRYNAQAVVLTPPVPQTLALLAAGEVRLEEYAFGRLQALEYAPCLALLALSSVPVELPAPGVLRRANDDVEWIADNAAKGVSDRGPALTVHFGAEFSRRFYDSDDETVYRRMCDRLQGTVATEFEAWQVKRWRYGRPTNPLEVGAWVDGLPRGLVLAGDAFAGARVEGAALSGLAAASTLLGSS